MLLTSAGPARLSTAHSGTALISSRRRRRLRADRASFIRSGLSRRTAIISSSLALSSQSGPFQHTATSCLSSASSSRLGLSSVGTRHADLLRGLFPRSGTWPPLPELEERLLGPFGRSAPFVRTLLRLPLLLVLCRQLAPFRRLGTRSQQALPGSFSQSVLFRLSLALWPSFADSFNRSGRFSGQGLSAHRFAAAFVLWVRAK